VCVHEVPNASTWNSITYEAAAVDQERSTTYLVPATDDARLPALFVDATAFESPEQSLHYKFLTESFPEFRFLDYAEYLELVLDPERREWFAGGMTEYLVPGQDRVFGFTAWDLGTNADATISCEQFQDLYDVLDGRLRVGDVAAVPANDLQREVLASCDVPSYDPSTALGYEAYTLARGCGTVRRYTLAALEAAEQQAEIGWQDLLVTDEAPLDIETVIAGIVTGTRQGELSHLNVRSASRGTPNCYVRDAYELLAEWDGQLVALECGPDQATVEPINVEEAQTCWEELRPEPVTVTPADFTATELMPLLDLPTTTAEERRAGVGRFGSKGANLAVLYQRIDSSLQLQGFLIPLHYYQAFMTESSWSVDLGGGAETLSYQETIERYLEDSTFSTDGVERRGRLDALRASMRAAQCDPQLVAAIETAILDTYGTDDVMVRFRSSSNAEDALNFNGAGLYDSTSACLADETDADTVGPSHCDASQPDERDVCRGLTRVWASLWNLKAFEEREWYGVDHREVAMGILVDTRTANELANIVAFTGNPLLQGDDRFLVNAQAGELDVVSAEAGVWPEKVLLSLDAGSVVEIERVRSSTELPEGEWVLDDPTLELLGASLANIAEVFPVDEPAPETATVLLDTEWKLRQDGQLVVKQVRSFLR
jgi:pyruvate,water dikinase